jgi:L-alanine-DL-glutamate epimerase-like enolase superfamily enzyme
MARLDAWLPGHVYAKSALDIALWDLTAGRRPAALRAAGRSAAGDLPLYHSITCVAPEEMARIAREAQAHPASRQFQVKLGADSDWQADIARLRLVREAVGPGPLVYGDWNCGATSLDAIRVGRAVAHLT